MKKIYMTVVSCLLWVSGVFAQDRYWVGPATGASWNQAANWSATSNGAGGASVPNGTGFSAIFDKDAVVHFDIATMNLGSLRIINSSEVNLFVTVNSVLNLTSTSATVATHSLVIDNGSTLTDSVSGDDDFIVNFLNDTKATIDGTWRFVNSVEAFDFGSVFTVPDAGGLTNDINVNGKIYLGDVYLNSSASGHVYLEFHAGSELHIDNNISNAPNADYDANSTIRITGRTDRGPTFTSGHNLGNIIYNSPGQVNTLSFSLLNRTILGNLTIENTNGRDLIIFGNGTGTSVQTFNNFINGDVNVSGNSNVLLSNVGTDNKVMNITIGGDVNAGGNVLSIQRHQDNPNAVITTPTTVRIAGNINHTNGIFTATSTKTNADIDIFIIEMNGTTPQTISSATGTINNTNNLLTLRMNNAAGVTLLSPLQIGRLSFDSPNKGVLTTTATNILTIMNRSTGPLPVNAPADNGYVNGPVRRRTANTGTYEIPVGKGGNLRMPEILPSDATESFFVIEYFNTGYPDQSVVLPLRGVTPNEYWIIERESGTEAAVRLFLDGTIPGTTANDAVFVAKYNGTDWISVKGTNGTAVVPGNSASGNVTSDPQQTFSPFTLGYGAQAALPINLQSFNGKKVAQGRSQLTWLISNHSTPERFEVMRSSDGKDFISLGVINADLSKIQYDFTDDAMLSGHNFYKLKMYDRDGSVTYSKIITIMNGVNGFFITSMIPTMVNDRARVNVSASRKGNIQLVVTDIHGRVVYQQMASINSENQEIWLNLSGLSSGAYHLTGYFSNERSSTLRFVKK